MCTCIILQLYLFIHFLQAQFTQTQFTRLNCANNWHNTFVLCQLFAQFTLYSKWIKSVKRIGKNKKQATSRQATYIRTSECVWERFYKKLYHISPIIFTKIFNIFLAQAIIPCCRKSSTIIWVPKTSASKNLNDFRPQQVRLGHHVSPLLTPSTGSPLGLCVEPTSVHTLHIRLLPHPPL